jgi:ssDNA-binding Zn-finger/Zn-ribbon topoisomerase 1
MTKTNPCVVNTAGMSDEEVESHLESEEWERCDYCKCIFVWDKLPDENVKYDHQPSEMGGATVYERVPLSYTCPECGYRTTC